MSVTSQYQNQVKVQFPLIYKFVLGATLLGAVLFALMGTLSSPQQTCTSQADFFADTSMCQAHVEISWSNWFVNQSKSTQLHFVDLLELLYTRPNSDE